MAAIQRRRVVGLALCQWSIAMKVLKYTNDWEHDVYNATSTHYFVEINVLGVKTRVDLNTIVPKRRVYAVEYSTK